MCCPHRLRLKKEHDDFKKHPEYNNFVREECASSSSSSSSSDEDNDYEETDVEKINCRDLEEEDQEHVVPRGLWSGGRLIQKILLLYKAPFIFLVLIAIIDSDGTYQ